MVATAYLVKQTMPDCVSVAHCVVADTNEAEGPGARRYRAKRAHMVQLVRSAIPTADEDLGIGFDVTGVSLLSAMERDTGTMRDQDGWVSMVKQLAHRLDDVLRGPLDSRHRATR